MWVMLSKHYSLGLINVWHLGRSDCVVKRCVLQPFRFVCCYGARTSGWSPGGETQRVVDSSAAGAGRVFHKNILPSK